MHRRTSPKAYRFSYGVYYFDLDLNELRDTARHIWFLSYNAFNVLSFMDRDHMTVPTRETRASVDAYLVERGIETAGTRVSLLTNTRIFGYVFNPVSFYFVRSSEGALRHVIAEVHNTHGERHLYDLAPLPSKVGAYVSTVEKAFYVSPFINMDASYEFQVAEDATGRLRIRLDEFHGEERFFQAHLDLRPKVLTNRRVALMLTRYPLITLQTIVLIHWHGLKLWLRGVRFHPHTRGAAKQ